MSATALICPHGQTIGGTVETEPRIAKAFLQPEPGQRLEVRDEVVLGWCEVCIGEPAPWK